MLSSREDRNSRERSDKRRARYEQVVRLHKQGISQRGIARLTGLHRITVRKFIAADAFPKRAPTVPRRSILDQLARSAHSRYGRRVEANANLHRRRRRKCDCARRK